MHKECRFKERPISEAPQDGTVIIGICKDGTRSKIHWNEYRYCILGPIAGSFPPGWSPAGDDIDNNLPLDDDDYVSFIRID